MIVNGIEDPRVECPQSAPHRVPEGLSIDVTDLHLCPAGEEHCTLTIDWAAVGEGAHELRCVNAAGASDPLVVEVPELSSGPQMIIALVVILLTTTIRRKYLRNRDRND